MYYTTAFCISSCHDLEQKINEFFNSLDKGYCYNIVRVYSLGYDVVLGTEKVVLMYRID